MKELSKRQCKGTLDQVEAFLTRFGDAHIERYGPNNVALRTGQIEHPPGYAKASELVIIRPDNEKGIYYNQGIVALGEGREGGTVIAVFSSEALDVPREVLRYAEELQFFEIEQSTTTEVAGNAPKAISIPDERIAKIRSMFSGGWIDQGNGTQSAETGADTARANDGQVGEVQMTHKTQGNFTLNTDAQRFETWLENRTQVATGGPFSPYTLQPARRMVRTDKRNMWRMEAVGDVIGGEIKNAISFEVLVYRVASTSAPAVADEERGVGVRPRDRDATEAATGLRALRRIRPRLAHNV